MPPACRCPVVRSSVGCPHSHCAVQCRRIGRLELIGAIDTLQLDAGTTLAAVPAEIEPHLAVAVAPPFNVQQACSSLEHLCHPNCDHRLRRCRLRPRRRWAGDQSPYQVAACPMQGGAQSVAVGWASIRQQSSCRRCSVRRRHKPPQRPGRSTGVRASAAMPPVVRHLPVSACACAGASASAVVPVQRATPDALLRAQATTIAAERGWC